MYNALLIRILINMVILFFRSVNDFDENEAEKDKGCSKGSLKSNAAKWTSNQVRENAVNTQRERKNKANREPPAEPSPVQHKEDYSLR